MMANNPEGQSMDDDDDFAPDETFKIEDFTPAAQKALRLAFLTENYSIAFFTAEKPYSLIAVSNGNAWTAHQGKSEIIDLIQGINSDLPEDAIRDDGSFMYEVRPEGTFQIATPEQELWMKERLASLKAHQKS